MFNFCLNCMVSPRSFYFLLSFLFFLFPNNVFHIWIPLWRLDSSTSSSLLLTIIPYHLYFNQSLYLKPPRCYLFFFFPFWLLNFTLFFIFYFFTFLLFYFFLPFFIFLPQGDLKVLQEGLPLAQWEAYLHVPLCSLQVCY